MLQELVAGRRRVEDVAQLLAGLPSLALGYARLDTARQMRTGVPEVVFAQGKRPEQTLEIAQRLFEAHGRCLVTRVSPRAARRLADWRPAGHYNPVARTWRLQPPSSMPPVGRVVVLSAGTADEPVAEEVTETLTFCGSRAERIADVGIAGLHRLLGVLHEVRTAEVVVAVAGMDGAMPAVVAGLTDRPVIAVPTSVGYGVARGGAAALRTMLASCAPGMAVVNIDNGFGAAVLAHRINLRAGRQGGGEAAR